MMTSKLNYRRLGLLVLMLALNVAAFYQEFGVINAVYFCIWCSVGIAMLFATHRASLKQSKSLTESYLIVFRSALWPLFMLFTSEHRMNDHI